jgi:D-threonate/D-erythronate kinase
VVAGSAHPATRRQVERAAERGLVLPLEVTSVAGAEWAGAQAVRALAAGKAPVLVAPAAPSPEGSAAVLAALRRAALATLARVRPAGLVLVGGETAYHVLEGLGLPPLWLESRLCPLVVRTRLMAGAYAGLALVTKGGSTGAPDLLASIVRQLARGAV